MDLKMSKEELHDSIYNIWEEIGRDPKKLNIEDKSVIELSDIYDKLRAIKLAFSLLFKEKANYALAMHLLANTFDDEEER
jgi:hypothetical protein